METRIIDGRINLRGNIVARSKPKFADYLLYLTDGTYKTPEYTSTGVKFVSVKDMRNGFLSLENTKFIQKNTKNCLHDAIQKRGT